MTSIVDSAPTGEHVCDELEDQRIAPVDSTAKRSFLGTQARRERLLGWSLFVGLSALFLRPILIAPIIGDDFLNPWFQFPTAGMTPTGILRYTINGTTQAGHFNYLGQFFGGVVFAFWTWLMADLGIRYSTIYAVTKLLVYLATVVSLASFIRSAADIVGRPLSLWRSRVYVAIPLYGVLQIHLPWSHDPVANYPLSGFAAAALGFMVLKYGVDACRTPSLKACAIAGALGTASILYYEINVACVVALVPIVAWGWHHHGGGRRAASTMVAPVAWMLVMPAAITVFLQLRAQELSKNYTGTEVAIGSGLARTFRVAFLGTLPGAGWPLSREFLNGPIAVRGVATVVLVVVATVVFCLATRFGRVEVPPNAISRTALVAVVAAPVIYWLGAILIQATTAKVQIEISRIGAVYNYYAMATAALAVLIVFCVQFHPRRLAIDFVRIAVVSGVIGFIAVQYMVNWNISDRFQDYTIPNRNLHLAFSEQPPMAKRCEVLRTWEEIVWPEYVEVTMIDGLQASYQYFHGEAFCAGFTRSI